jgi:hypothetical protein
MQLCSTVQLLYNVRPINVQNRLASGRVRVNILQPDHVCRSIAFVADVLMTTCSPCMTPVTLHSPLDMQLKVSDWSFNVFTVVNTCGVRHDNPAFL